MGVKRVISWVFVCVFVFLASFVITSFLIGRGGNITGYFIFEKGDGEVVYGVGSGDGGDNIFFEFLNEFFGGKSRSEIEEYGARVIEDDFVNTTGNNSSDVLSDEDLNDSKGSGLEGSGGARKVHTGGVGDSNARVNISNLNFTKLLPHFEKFIGERTTKWDQVTNLSKVCNGEAVLEIPGVGMIRWRGCVDARGANFTRDVLIGRNVISVDSYFLHSSFNSSAEITLSGLEYDYVPSIYRNGKLCLNPYCNITRYKDGVLVFNVFAFSSYTTGPNSGLQIWDETDLGMPYAGETRYSGNTTYFFANYTNLTSGGAISDANCYINFSDVSSSMDYNSTKGAYEFSRTFSSPGYFDYNITCSRSGFATLSTDDGVSIQTNPSNLSSPGPNGANVSFVSGSRAEADSPELHSSFAGNLTELAVFGRTITQSWQGYYGNVSGSIVLKDGTGNVFYNWSVVNPTGEVYVSRSSGVNFANISCASSSDISIEEDNSGQNASDVDSISNTFSVTDHPSFYVGHKEISENSCFSTNIFDLSGVSSSSFYEVLLSDNSANLVYTAILERDVLGFDLKSHDFEVIVSEDGHRSDTFTTPYYFYVEFY